MKILVAMSGGVDSSAVADILVSEGHKVAGAIMRLNNYSQSTEDDINSARAVCETLSIPFFVFDFTFLFDEYVVMPFCRSYLANETPNPCVECNKHLKFGAFLSKARDLGYDAIATGHYARIVSDNGEYRLMRAKCAEKDQSYVLYGLSGETLSRVLFPLGDFDSKTQVRNLAGRDGVLKTDRGESQDICFIPDGDYASFIQKHTGEVQKHGNFVSVTGETLGRHGGLYNYTIGQRRGLGVAAGERIFVLSKNSLCNEIVLGEEKLLYKSEIICKNITFVSGKIPSQPITLSAKTRYRAPEAIATLTMTSLTDGICSFRTPVRAPAPGQSVVFYDGDFVLGGGIIC